MKKNKLNSKEAIYFILFNSITASLVSTYILQFHREYFFKKAYITCNCVFYYYFNYFTNRLHFINYF